MIELLLSATAAALAGYSLVIAAKEPRASLALRLMLAAFAYDFLLFVAAIGSVESITWWHPLAVLPAVLVASRYVFWPARRDNRVRSNAS